MKLQLVIASIMLLSATIFAEITKEGILLIPKTVEKPIIDGQMDGVWHNSGENLCLKVVDIFKEPDDWFDLFGSIRLLWDDENIYIWTSIYDDNIQPGTDFKSDGIELYFDADNSKTQGVYDCWDDISLVFSYGEKLAEDIDAVWLGSCPSYYNDPRPGIKFDYKNTELGYDYEISIPLENLKIDAENVEEFGFEILINDNDGGESRESSIKWWSPSIDSWMDASTLGTAVLDDREISEMLDIRRVDLAITDIPAFEIDGEMEALWYDHPEITDVVYWNGTDPAKLDDWKDIKFSARHAWDNKYFYGYYKIWDNIINDQESNFFYDGIDLYFDGDNSKEEGNYDGFDDIGIWINHGDIDINDIDINWTVEGQLAWDPREGILFDINNFEEGYTIEVAIPLENLWIKPEYNWVFGYEIAVKDADESKRDTYCNWWNESNDQWIDASLFGTAILKESINSKNKRLPAAYTENVTNTYIERFRFLNRSM